ERQPDAIQAAAASVEATKRLVLGDDELAGHGHHRSGMTLDVGRHSDVPDGRAARDPDALPDRDNRAPDTASKRARPSAYLDASWSEVMCPFCSSTCEAAMTHFS